MNKRNFKSGKTWHKLNNFAAFSNVGYKSLIRSVTIWKAVHKILVKLTTGWSSIRCLPLCFSYQSRSIGLCRLFYFCWPVSSRLYRLAKIQVEIHGQGNNFRRFISDTKTYNYMLKLKMILKTEDIETTNNWGNLYYILIIFRVYNTWICMDKVCGCVCVWNIELLQWVAALLQSV